MCILTPWDEFKSLDLNILSNLTTKMIFDGRNILDKDKVQDAGFVYFAIGKRTNGSELIAENPASAVLNGKQ